MHLVDEPGTTPDLRQHDARSALQRQLRRQDGRRISRRQRDQLEHRRPVAGFGARVPELRVPSAVQSARRARVRQVLHLHRHDGHHADAGLSVVGRRTVRTTPCCSSGRRKIRRRRRTTAARRASCSASRIRSANHNGGQIAIQSAGHAGHVRTSGCSTSARPTAAAAAIRSTRPRTWLGVRQDPADRSARQRTARTASTAFPPANPFVKKAKPDTLGEIYALRRPQSAALLVGLQDRRDVRRRHRPEHRRRDQPGHRRRESRLEQVGGELPSTAEAAGGPRRTRAARPA